jgi:diguanylate cyclase (GGDEF)-like protein
MMESCRDSEAELAYPQSSEKDDPRPIRHPRSLGWIGTSALAMGGSNQSIFLITALFIGQDGIRGQGSAAVLLLAAGLILSYAAAPGWTELVLMSPDRVGGISAACSAAFKPYSPVLSALAGVCNWWGWVPACGLTAILSATAIHQWSLPDVPINVIACSLIGLFTVINLCGVRWVARLAVPLAVLSATLAFISMMAPILNHQVDWARATSFHLTPPFPGWFGTVTSSMAGLYLIGFGAPAFEAAACHVGETKDAARNVPRAMIASAGMAAIYFIGLPVVWLGALGPEALGQDLTKVLDPTFAPVFGSFAKSAAIGFMTFSMFHGTLQPLAGSARVLSQLAEDGLAPRFLTQRLSTDAPWAATLLTAGVSTLFVLIGDPIWLIAAANFTYLIGISLPSVAVWLLRRDAPEAIRPYRAPPGTIGLGLGAACIWGCSALLGFEQFGLAAVVVGLLMAYSGAGLYAWRKLEDRRLNGLRGIGRSLHIKLTGAMLLVLALDTAGYVLAISAIPADESAFISGLEDIFVAVAFLTISVGIVLPGMIARSADRVSAAARRLAFGTVRDFADAMQALGEGRLDEAYASIDIFPVAVRSSDELGIMASSFNMLQEGIRDAALGLRNAREGLSSARAELVDANTALERTLEEQHCLSAELLHAKNEAIYDASHDALTGLPNRASFIAKLDKELALAGEGRRLQFPILFIDLDRFKVVNDSLGHSAGNDLITQVAKRLSEFLCCGQRNADELYSESSDNVLARLGGDEFTVLLGNTATLANALSIAKRIQQTLSEPFEIAHQDVYISASVGVALSSSGHFTAADILHDADLAMYRAKSLGKARVEVYDASMQALATSRLLVESNLRRAIRKAEFVLHYQPIVALGTRQIVGFEALVRWRRSEDDLVYPSDFISIAEETGMIVPLGQWVLREACRQAKAWEQLELEQPMQMSINISPRQFAHHDLFQHLQEAVWQSGVDPRLINLEITESGTMGDPERAFVILSQLKALGLKLSLDDFGTGSSSLSYLHRFPLDVLKIDRSFVSGLMTDIESKQIVNTIMTLANGMAMDVVAEGIETEGQASELERLGCAYGQGYLFAKALTAAEATAAVTGSSLRRLTRQTDERLLG